MKRHNITDTDPLFDRVLFDDDGRASDFLKDLISADGLRNAWLGLLQRMRILERQQSQLWNIASRSALERDFVSRSQYGETVEGSHQDCLMEHAGRLGQLEAAGAKDKAQTEDHGKEVRCLHERCGSHEQRMENIEGDLSRVEVKDMEQHQLLLRMSHQADERCAGRESALKVRLQELFAHLEVQGSAIQVLSDKLQQQQLFLHGDQLKDHMLQTCSTILKQYVHKDDMLSEVASLSEHLITPMREGLSRFTKDVDQKVSALVDVDRALQDGLNRAVDNTTHLSKACESQFLRLAGQIETKVPTTQVNSLEYQMMDKFHIGDEALAHLSRDSTLKFQELVARLSELQLILADHEHAMQHHAEELLNRSTKYDLVVCQQRIDKCAIRDKVDVELKELQRTVAWQNAQLEYLGYSQSFGGLDPHAISCQDSLQLPGRHSALEACDTSTESTAAPFSIRESVTFSLNKVPEQSKKRSVVPAMVGNTEAYSLLRMQMESLAQGLLGLGHLAIKAARQGFSREVRAQRETELMNHLTCVVQWIMHKKAPLAWDPEKLTTFALCCMRHAGDGDADFPTQPPHDAHRILQLRGNASSPGATLHTILQSSQQSDPMQVGPNGSDMRCIPNTQDVLLPHTPRRQRGVGMRCRGPATSRGQPPPSMSMSSALPHGKSLGGKATGFADLVAAAFNKAAPSAPGSLPVSHEGSQRASSAAGRHRTAGSPVGGTRTSSVAGSRPKKAPSSSPEGSPRNNHPDYASALPPIPGGNCSGSDEEMDAASSPSRMVHRHAEM